MFLWEKQNNWNNLAAPNKTFAILSDQLPPGAAEHNPINWGSNPASGITSQVTVST